MMKNPPCRNPAGGWPGNDGRRHASGHATGSRGIGSTTHCLPPAWRGMDMTVPPVPDQRPVHPAPDASGAADAHRLFLYQLYHGRVRQEYELINHRMMWMVLSEAFMLALWSSIPGRLLSSNGVQKAWPMGLIAAGGLFLTVASCYSIAAAHREINRLSSRYDVLTAGSSTGYDGILPPLEGSTRAFGHVAPWAILAFLALLWTALLAISCGA